MSTSVDVSECRPKLKPYQEQFCREALQRAFGTAGQVDWQELSRGLFADMGTGKTPATILLLEWLRRILEQRKLPEADFPSLLVVPAAVKWNWQAEIRRFAQWVPEEDIIIVDGPKKKREEQLAKVQETQPSFVITNYETIRLHREWFEAYPCFLSVVADEAHPIKNREARRSVALKAVEEKCRLALTGTPITNKPDDLWSILHFLDPGQAYMRTVWVGKKGYKRKEVARYRDASLTWGSYWSFTSEYCSWE